MRSDFSLKTSYRYSGVFHFFILEIGMNVRAHLLVLPRLHFVGSTAFKKMIW